MLFVWSGRVVPACFFSEFSLVFNTMFDVLSNFTHLQNSAKEYQVLSRYPIIVSSSWSFWYTCLDLFGSYNQSLGEQNYYIIGRVWRRESQCYRRYCLNSFTFPSFDQYSYSYGFVVPINSIQHHFTQLSIRLRHCKAQSNI